MSTTEEPLHEEINTQEHETVPEENGFAKAMKSVGRAAVTGMKIGAFVGSIILTVGTCVAAVEWMRPKN